MQFIDLFAGCGGLSLGLVQAGWEGVLAVEKDVNAFETFRHNFLDSKYIERFKWPEWFPKKKRTIQHFTRYFDKEIKELRGEIQLIAGGPPCQGYSMAGKRNSRDSRNQLFQSYIEVVRKIESPLLLFENVTGISHAFVGKRKRKEKPKPHSEVIREMIQDSGYVAGWYPFSSKDFAVAQRRPRNFLFGIRKDLVKNLNNIDIKSLVEKNRRIILKKLRLPVKRRITAAEAISDLSTTERDGITPKELEKYPDSDRFKRICYEGPETQYQKILHRPLNGQTPDSLRLPNHSEIIQKRFQELIKTQPRGVSLSGLLFEKYGMNKRTQIILDPDKPAPTITTLPDDIIHYTDPRILTVREIARLQSFPDWFEFKGKYTTGGKLRKKEIPRYSQVGNAVSPLVARVIGEALKEINDEIILKGV